MNNLARPLGTASSAHAAAGTTSVIIPTCDRPDYLRETIASVIAQTLPPREILVIDNGRVPVDRDTLDQRVRLHRIAPRVGPSVARNAGAALAQGDYLAFIDDDDWWEPGFLLNAHRVMAQEEVRCVYGRKLKSQAGRITPYKLATPDELTIATLLWRNPGTAGMNLLIDRQLYFEIGGFDRRLLLSEDRALAIEVLLKGERIAVAPEARAVLRHHHVDRLRQRHMRKLPFVWKYRRLYSPAGFVWAVGRVFIRTLFGTIERRIGVR